jgi:hypothetical protein
VISARFAALLCGPYVRWHELVAAGWSAERYSEMTRGRAIFFS